MNVDYERLTCSLRYPKAGTQEKQIPSCGQAGNLRLCIETDRLSLMQIEVPQATQFVCLLPLLPVLGNLETPST